MARDNGRINHAPRHDARRCILNNVYTASASENLEKREYRREGEREACARFTIDGGDGGGDSTGKDSLPRERGGRIFN